ncbi:MAG: LPXTG cell wall anchor domain-containing protein [Clostridia bacterium]|nr:LPXTG cell wall anchor domain-containing protein [Clostridia bacterium]
MKKLLMLTTILCLLMGVCPVNTAQAASHFHALCTIDGCEHFEHDHSDYYFVPLRAASDLSAGCYYLTEDTDVGTLTIGNGRELRLCLNGHTLYHNGIILNENDDWYNTRLYLCDCKGGGQIKPRPGSSAGITVNNSALFLYGGKVTGHTNTAITLHTSPTEYSAAELYVFGGEISGNSGVNGGGIACINDPSNDTFPYVALMGGVIRNNTATRGGGVYISRGFLCLEDTSIADNAATEGGGVYMTGNSYYELRNGVHIERNRTTGGMGGGLYVSGKIGGEVSGKDLFIYNNTSDGKPCNLYLARDMHRIVSMGGSSGKIGLYVEDPVTPDEPLRFLDGFDDTSVREEDIAVFVSDQGYGIRLQDYPYEDVRGTEGVLYVPTTPTPAPVPPATGDSAPVLLWAALLLMTAGAAVLLRRRAAR